MIGALEDADDYKAFEAAITADYNAESTVERELVLRLASLLWRLRRATTIETSLFEIQAGHINDFRQARQGSAGPRDVAQATIPAPALDLPLDLARCFLRLANLPSYPLDRLSRYEATLWRQIGQTLYALDALGRHKPHERQRLFQLGRR